MANPDTVYIGTSFLKDTSKRETLSLKLANRHGLITGATGTGKTVSLQILAEGFSDAGVAVFAADVKGDLSGISQKGVEKDFIKARIEKIGFNEHKYQSYPVMYWDLFGDQGHPIRSTISEMGPLLLSRLMELNEVQEGVLNIAFRVAADDGLLILDLKDLRALVSHIGERAAELTTKYGNVTKQSVGTIQRRLLVLEEQGASSFFGEPALDIRDFMRTARDGRGYINVLAADKLMNSPRLYATFLFWLLSELFEELPEVGDPDKPKLVFFFDEAHLLFDQAPKPLLEKIEQVTRLIRSKGVGVYYVTQNPLDVPDSVSSQLGNRIQHALRAFTPREQKAVRAAATTFRQNPELDTEKTIMELEKGEALVSVLEGKGAPTIVQRTLVRPPCSRLGPVTPDERKAVIAASPVNGQYEKTVDRESAFEILERRARGVEDRREPTGGTIAGKRDVGYEQHGDFRVPPARRGDEQRSQPQSSDRYDYRRKADGERAPVSRRQTAGEAFGKSLLRSLGTAIGSVIGGILRGRR